MTLAKMREGPLISDGSMIYQRPMRNERKNRYHLLCVSLQPNLLPISNIITHSHPHKEKSRRSTYDDADGHAKRDGVSHPMYTIEDQSHCINSPSAACVSTASMALLWRKGRICLDTYACWKKPGISREGSILQLPERSIYIFRWATDAVMQFFSQTKGIQGMTMATTLELDLSQLTALLESIWNLTALTSLNLSEN